MPRLRWADTSYAPPRSFLGRDDLRAGGLVPGDPGRPARPGAARGPARQRRRRPGRPVQRDALRPAGRARAARTRRGHQVPHRAGSPDQGAGDPGGGAGLGQRVRARLARAARAGRRAHRRGDRGAAGRCGPRLRRQAGAGRLLGGAGPDRPGPEARRPGRPGVRHRGGGARRAGPGRAVHAGRLLRDAGPAAAHLPRRRAGPACSPDVQPGRPRARYVSQPRC